MLLHSWNFTGKSTGVGCHFLLQRIFQTQGSNLGLPHCRQTLYCLSHQGKYIYRKKLTNIHASEGRAENPEGRVMIPQSCPELPRITPNFEISWSLPSWISKLCGASDLNFFPFSPSLNQNVYNYYPMPTPTLYFGGRKLSFFISQVHR